MNGCWPRNNTEFELSQQTEETKADLHHHKKTNTTQEKLLQDGLILTFVREEMGNTFKEKKVMTH